MMGDKKRVSGLVGPDDERAVSPVIGVILMVAITVILASVIAVFVLDMGESVEQDVQAGVTIEGDGTNEVTITWTSEGSADHLEIRGGDITTSQIGDTDSSVSDVYISTIGEDATLEQGSDNLDVDGDGNENTDTDAEIHSVVAVGPDGDETTIQTFEVTT